MLATWLNQVRPTAGDLVNSLRASSVGKDTLAEDSEKGKYCNILSDHGRLFKSIFTIVGDWWLPHTI